MCLFFFFQAEDGIRDRDVTGVQTCALPIFTPSGEVGSIGVYALHTEFSEADAKLGVKSTFIKAGRFKTAGNDVEPLDDESRAYLQAGVDRYYDMFTAAVAKYRGVKLDDV